MVRVGFPKRRTWDGKLYSAAKRFGFSRQADEDALSDRSRMLTGKRSATILPPARSPKARSPEAHRSRGSRFEEPGGFALPDVPSIPAPSLRGETRKKRGLLARGHEALPTSTGTASPPASRSVIRAARDTESIVTWPKPGLQNRHSRMGPPLLHGWRIEDSLAASGRAWRRRPARHTRARYAPWRRANRGPQ